MPIQVQFRRGTAAQWTAANPILAEGEMGMELDTYRFKIGNGSTAWNSLVYGGLIGGQGATGPSGTFTAPQTINAQTAAYTLVLTDKGKIVKVTSSTAVTITIPTNANAPFDIGTHIDICNYGTGVVTLAGASGVTLNARGAFKELTQQFSVGSVVKMASDEWIFVGPAS